MHPLFQFVVLAVIAAATAAPQNPQDVQIVRYDTNNGLDSYSFAFEQSDGTKQEQQGEVVNEGREDEYLSVKGSFTYIGQDGVTYVVTYVADQNGYQPEIEQGPGGAVPDAVLSSLLG
ncbi:unnamed protein product [Parnassius mnemosyne]|uniref:Uncharacterized protein n=1 Tax=Parnassius mnemosyne TaxID=213953 RepID=A0AAV1MC49_9NEOP